jgi:hypothetical protein
LRNGVHGPRLTQGGLRLGFKSARRIIINTHVCIKEAVRFGDRSLGHAHGDDAPDANFWK